MYQFKRTLLLLVLLVTSFGFMLAGCNCGPGPKPVAPKELESIEVKVKPTAFELNSPFSTTGIGVEVKLTDGSSFLVFDEFKTEEGWNVNQGTFNSAVVTAPGEEGYEINFSYTFNGVTKEDSFKVRIYDPSNITSIELDATNLGIKQYEIGTNYSDFKWSGLVAKLTINGGQPEETVVEKVNFSDDNIWKFKANDGAGNYVELPDTTVWPTYGWKSQTRNTQIELKLHHIGKGMDSDNSFTVDIYDPNAIKNFAIAQGPQKDWYNYGSVFATDFDCTGMIVKVVLDDGKDTEKQFTHLDFSDGTKWVFENVDFDGHVPTDPNDPNDKATARLTYKSSTGETYGSAEFGLQIRNYVSGISIKTNAITSEKGPNKLDYMIGESLDLSGLEIEVEHGYSNANTTHTDFTGANWEIDIFNSGNATDELPIEVRYKEGTNTYSDTFKVVVYNIDGVVIPNTLKTVEKTTFFDGETEDFFRKEFVKDSNKVTVNLKAIAKTSSREFALTSPLVTVSLPEENGFNATTKTFRSNSRSGVTAQAVVSVTLNSITREASVPLKVRSVYQFSDTDDANKKLEIADANSKVPATSFLNITETLNKDPLVADCLYNMLGHEAYTASFVEYGYYPQTLKGKDEDNNDIVIYNQDERVRDRGGFEMHLGSDGCWYVSCVVTPFSTGEQYKFSGSNGLLATHKNQTRWFKMEPIVWRVLDNNYDGTGGALLWSLLSLDRVFFFDNGIDPNDETPDPNDSTKKIKDSAGKTSRPSTIAGAPDIEWYDYQFSTVRAYLNGTYEDGDPKIGTFDPYLSSNKIEGKGFAQRAFTANNLLKEVDLGYTGTTVDKVFLLSVDELSTSKGSYWFIEDVFGNDENKYRQVQCTKQLTDYALARGSKRWTKKTMEDGGSPPEIAGAPGCEFWTRTSNSSGIRAVCGTGRVFGTTNISMGRGAYPACSIVPAICVPAAVLPTPPTP